MKNAIIYYYNLNPPNIHQLNKMYKFSIDNNYYTLVEIEYDLEYIEKTYKLSLYINEYNNRIILNNQNNIITYINRKSYVLLMSNKSLDRKITIDDIIEFNNKTKGINYKVNDWYNLWINKIDYFEYQINELENKYPLIKESFNYFSGLTETAISLLNNMNIKPVLCICHNRIKSDMTLFDLYNPFTYIIDSNVRDIAEYIKDTKEYKNIIKYYNKNELILFFIRILYPSYYFDKYEEIIKQNKLGNEIKIIIDNIDKYELLIKKTYISLKDICQLPDIDWLIK